MEETIWASKSQVSGCGSGSAGQVKVVSLEAQLPESDLDYFVSPLAAAAADMVMEDTFGPSMKLLEAADIHSPASLWVLWAVVAGGTAAETV